MAREPLLALAAAAVLGAALAASPAAACSMVAGYKEPSGLELAAQADAIVIATVVGEQRGPDEWDRALILKPTRLMKGKGVPARVTLPDGYLAGTSGDVRRALRSAPRELREAHPDAGSGGCVRMLFAPGMQVLVFLKRGADGRFSAIRKAFARDAEDVSGSNALWVKAVREYAVIAGHPRASWPPGCAFAPRSCERCVIPTQPRSRRTWRRRSAGSASGGDKGNSNG